MPAQSGRAGAAYEHEFSKWQGLIDSAATDRSMTADQRAAAVMALKGQQKAAASGARRRVAEEERQNEKAFRREMKRLTGRAPTPT